MNYYNEIEKYAAQWLRNLIQAGLIPPGEVDERSIADVTGGDLAGYTQCHFFAGIGGWSLALKLAGWPADKPVWTGSCPCQPFSNAGAGEGTADPRHLWPEFHRLIAGQTQRPPAIFGEQVASPAGRGWLTGVRSDLEALGYCFGAADLCAAGVGAPHIRQRLYWVGDTSSTRPSDLEQCGEPGAQKRGIETRSAIAESGDGYSANPWDDFELIGPDRQGKYRRIESGLTPVAPRVPETMGQLRAFGNAIVPQLAAEFIKAANV